MKVVVFCKVCNEKKDTLICVIERGPNKSEFGHVRFTSTSVQCCNKKTFISVKGDVVTFDLSKSFNFVEKCILRIDVANVVCSTDTSSTFLLKRQYLYSELLSLDNSDLKQGCLDNLSSLYVNVKIVNTNQ